VDLFSYEFQTLDAQPLPLAGFRGKAVLLVNTASQCGYTPQYAGLQSLWQRFRERGLLVLGVPSNDFGGQEPGSGQQIADFSAARYRVDFPLTEKVSVIGPHAHPLYRQIAQELGEGGSPRWNFHKFLFDRDGELAGAWPARVAPDDPPLLAAIEAALG